MKKRTAALLCALAVLLLCACGAAPAKEQKDIDLAALYDELAAREGMCEMVKVPDNRTERLFGVRAEDCGELIIALCAESVRADEIWLAEAVDEAAAQRIEELAAGRLEQRKAEMENYLPDQYRVLCAAQLLREGRYVALFVSPEADRLADRFREALGS